MVFERSRKLSQIYRRLETSGKPWVAALNGTAATLLVIGYVLIRRGQVSRHRRVMIAAFAASTLLAGAAVAGTAVGGVPRDNTPFSSLSLFFLCVLRILCGESCYAASGGRRRSRKPRRSRPRRTHGSE